MVTKNFFFHEIPKFVRELSISLWHGFTYVVPLWLRIAIFCLLSSILLISTLDTNVLVAPVLKMLLFVKVFFVKTLPSWALLLITSIKKALAKLTILLGGLEAWSLKKLVRHCIRFIVTISARIVILTFLINLFFGKERKGIKKLPRFILLKIKDTWINYVVEWWNRRSERQKRIATGLVLCIILVMAGQALIGVSILVFDLVWEVVIVLSKTLLRAWRWLTPILLKLVPNAIGSIFTNKIVPFFANTIPMIKDDFRVIYLRSNLRERYREYRKRLLKYSRTHRPSLRDKIRPMVPSAIRARKNSFLDKAIKIEDDS